LGTQEDAEEEEAPQCRSPTKFPKRAEYLNLRRTKSFSTETTENSSLQRRKSRFRNSTFSVYERERERERFEADHPYKLKEQQEASNPNSPRPLPGALSSPGMLAAV
jgi:hypothetical protein